MKNKEKSPYSTNKFGLIKAPKKVSEGDPKAKVIKAKDDLRTRRG